MNHVGSPNWISGVALCAGNTAAVNRLTYGWFPMGDFNNTNCIVLIGHNPTRHSWTPIYSMIRTRQARGAKLIVLDPRKSENAERADIWLPLKAGSDTAMLFGWLKVIFDEELYDKEFVRDWTVGFEELQQRVNEFPLERVAELTGCAPDQIAAAARMYATSGPSIIPWTPITDQQRNSTSGIRLQTILRAVCGYVDVVGGETLQGLHPDIVPETDIEMHEVLPEAQKRKQLGTEHHPVFTYRGQDALREPMKRVWGREYINQVVGCYMANPNSTFKAMAGEGPYPVKAFVFMGNNPLLSYANMPLILKGMMNQDLIVAHEQFMTPSAQLADYVLPADSWLERPWLSDMFGWMSSYRPSEKSMEPPGECESTFSFLKRLAGALGRPEVIPWHTIEDLYDWRLEKTGMTFSEFAATHEVFFKQPEYQKYKRVGFATPSGKVELKSSVLESLGFRPLALLPRRSASSRRLHAETIHRRARRWFLPNGAPSHSRNARPASGASGVREPRHRVGPRGRGGPVDRGGDRDRQDDCPDHPSGWHARRTGAHSPRMVEARSGAWSRGRAFWRPAAVRCPAHRRPSRLLRPGAGDPAFQGRSLPTSHPG